MDFLEFWKILNEFIAELMGLELYEENEVNEVNEENEVNEVNEEKRENI